MNIIGNALLAATTQGSAQQPPPPPTGGAGAGGAGGAQPPTTAHTLHAQHEPVDPAPAKLRWFLFFVTEILLFALVFLAVDYILSKITSEGFYVWVIALIGWAILSVLAFKLFFRTVGVYQLAHTQDMVTGRLRQYKAGTRLLLPWETLTPDKIVDTEVKVIEISAIRVHAGDGSPFDATGKIRYHVAPERSHLYIGVHKPDLELSLTAIAHQIIREEAARYPTAENLIAHLPDTRGSGGNLVLGIISTIGDRFMNGPNVTEIENNHGVEIDGVPISIAPAKETEERLLKRFEDARLAESATLLMGPNHVTAPLKDRLEATRLALLNDPEANLVHTVTETKETGDQTITRNFNISGAAGDSIKDITAIAAIATEIIANTGKGRQQQGGGGKQHQQKRQKQQQIGGQTT